APTKRPGAAPAAAAPDADTGRPATQAGAAGRVEPGATPPGQPPADRAPSRVDVGRARVLVREADDMLAANRFDAAERLYNDALALVPGLPEATAGLARLQQHRENAFAPTGTSLIETIKREDAVRWQRAESEYRFVERAIRDHVAHHRFEQANQLTHRARQVVDAGRQYASPTSLYDALKAEADELAKWVRREERNWHEIQVAEQIAEVKQQQAARIRHREENRRRERDALMSQAYQHRKDGELDAAIAVLKQVIVIDPKHEPARWLLDILTDRLEYVKAGRTQRRLEIETQRTLNDIEESRIPWLDQLRYPEDWPEMMARPTRRKKGQAPYDNVLWGALDTPVPVDFRHEPFNRAIERLADAQGVNVLVNWHDLTAAGVDPATPIDIHLPNDVTMKKALTSILQQAGGQDAALGFDVADGVISIATQDFLDRNVYPATYYVADLLMEVPNFKHAPLTELHGATHARPRRAVSAFSDPDRPWLFGDDDDDEPEPDPGRERRTQHLIDVITSLVDADSWDVNRPGAPGTIKEFNGQLVITQNSSAQRQIRGLLDQLRERRTTQIAIESRFITVSSHYLEEVGIDLDITLNNGTAGFDFLPGGRGPAVDSVLGSRLLLPRNFSRLGFTPNTPTLGNALPGGATAGGATGLTQPFVDPALVPQGAGLFNASRATPVPVQNNILNFTDPETLSSDISGTFAGTNLGPALNIFGSFLDNIQVDFLIRATQADSRTSVLTAPRLVMMNGQWSWVAVTVQTNFVSQLNPVVATGAAAQAPVTQTINAGAVLLVNATVSPDKRYVTMTLEPAVTRLNAISTFLFSAGVTGVGFVQLPELSTQAIQTTVSVPDGGTLLFGGQKLASETDIEAGVPLLSKIPILKRLYSSRVTVKDEQTLLILVKPTILINAEQEERAFPGFRQG
ncbi:MAG: hypothetical protein ACE5E6_07195, partial [Phycisphaerae bacterium]